MKQRIKRMYPNFCLATWRVSTYFKTLRSRFRMQFLNYFDGFCLFQITLMDANYVMDETLGATSFEISNLSLGQKKTESFVIGKVGQTITLATGNPFFGNVFGRLFRQAALIETVASWNCNGNPFVSEEIRNYFIRNTSREQQPDHGWPYRLVTWHLLIAKS